MLFHYSYILNVESSSPGGCEVFRIDNSYDPAFETLQSTFFD